MSATVAGIRDEVHLSPDGDPVIPVVLAAKPADYAGQQLSQAAAPETVPLRP